MIEIFVLMHFISTSKIDISKLKQVYECVRLQREQEKAASTDFYTVSGLSEAQLKKRLEGTYLWDMALVLHDIEQRKGINFKAIYAIGALESGYGKCLSNSYNYFGITGKGGYRAFNSKKESLQYLAKLLNNELYKGKSIDDIARIYCPPNADKWAKDVKWLMKNI